MINVLVSTVRTPQCSEGSKKEKPRRTITCRMPRVGEAIARRRLGAEEGCRLGEITTAVGQDNTMERLAVDERLCLNVHNRTSRHPSDEGGMGWAETGNCHKDPPPSWLHVVLS